MALDEDAIGFDPASAAVFGQAEADAYLVAKSDLVLAGQEVFSAVFQRIDPRIEWSFEHADGSSLSSGERFASA